MRWFIKILKSLIEKEVFYQCSVSFTGKFKIVQMKLRQSEIDKINTTNGLMIISQYEIKN